MPALPESHIKILRAAIAGTLPNIIAFHDPEYSYDAIRELRDAGLITAKESRSLAAADRSFHEPRITIAGREYLAAIDHSAANPADGKPPGGDEAEVNEWHDRPLGKIAITLAGGLLVVGAGWAIVHWWNVLTGNP